MTQANWLVFIRGPTPVSVGSPHGSHVIDDSNYHVTAHFKTLIFIARGFGSSAVHTNTPLAWFVVICLSSLMSPLSCPGPLYSPSHTVSFCACVLALCSFTYTLIGDY